MGYLFYFEFGFFLKERGGQSGNFPTLSIFNLGLAVKNI